ncbi:MAG TPA: homoserine dehydrogenase [Acidimicrobiia bacterium]|jgi:homoserine dehydrogenase
MAVGVGILGGGVVGGSLARRLLDDRAGIAAKTGLDLALVRVGVRDAARIRSFPSQYVTTDLAGLVEDPEVQLVVELMGGQEPARALVMRALDLGKPVVTANKELVAADGPKLFDQAAERGVPLLFEAAVGGGIPLIRPLMESLAGEKISRVLGIVNGTTNFILTEMDESQASFAQALARAQELGLAESDPSADVGGADAAAKAAILAGLAFGTWVGADNVHREGIEKLQSADLAHARRLGYAVKLLAVADELQGRVVVRVHPAFIPLDHPLAAVRGATNAVFIEGPAVGRLLFSGPGAGGEPTATAVLGDVIDAARELLAGSKVTARIRFGDKEVGDFAKSSTRWYLRVEVADAPGVLSQVAGVFGSHGVSIGSVWQDGRGDEATLILVTHEATEAAQRAAAADLADLAVVGQVAAAIRVEAPDPR